MDFPRLVYQRTKGSEFKHVLVETLSEYETKLSEGWHGTVPEALGVAAAAPTSNAAPGAGSNGNGGSGNDNAPPTRAELEAKAKELNISFQPNIGNRKLLARINAVLENKGS